MKLTLDDLVPKFDPATFARGIAYVKAGKVLNVLVDGDLIHGEVAGSEWSPYQQSIRLKQGPRGIQVKGDCSCPMSFNCKHVVAVLLTSLQQIGREKASAPVGDEPTPVPAGTEPWLRQLAELRAAHPGAPDAPGLAYVLVGDRPDGTLRLHLCKPRPPKGGSSGGFTVHGDFAFFLGNGGAQLDPQDEEAIRMLLGLSAGGTFGQGIKPAGLVGARLLDQLCARGRLFVAHDMASLKSGGVAPVQCGPARAAAPHWQTHPADSIMRLCWLFDDGEALEHMLATEPPTYLHGGKLGELLPPASLAALAPRALQRLVLEAPPLRAHERAGMAARLIQQGLDAILPLPQAAQVRERRDVVPTPVLRLGCHEEVFRQQILCLDYAELLFDYDGEMVEDDSQASLRSVAGDSIDIIERDSAAERAAAALLARFGFASPPDDGSMAHLAGTLLLPGVDDWFGFSRHVLPRLRETGWQIEFDDNYRYDFAEPEEWYADLNEEGESGNEWFALELGIVVNGERHALLPLLVELIRGAPQDFDAAAMAARREDSEIMVELRDDSLVILPWRRVRPILATLGELYFSERIGAALRLPVLDAARLAELEAAVQLRWMGGERLRALGEKLHGFDGIGQVAAPAGLQARLREYQLAGLAWMQFLREYGFAGILADDMGLGKTIQTLAHILIEKEAGRLDRPALVVAPTSLMANWQAEAVRFAPGLRVLLLHGKERKALFEQIGAADLVLTTYPLLGRDEAALRQQRFHLLILDEAQYIKNSKSKAAQSARLLDARHRLCLTGTPIQNHLGELWSQFHFLMPGLLGAEKSFNAEFRRPIEQGGDSQRKDLLSRRIKPFMLRRTKDKVATELPPKTEIVLAVDLGSAQRDLYETVRVAMDRKVREEISRKGLARSQIVILDALLKLRQVCCDPRLLKTGGEGGSAKLEALMELLETLQSEGRRVLVFSQFTSMLALIEDELRKRAVAYLLLTGQTDDRAEVVAAFQAGQAGVFLISLKAGGVGLNLTAADTVIHYDPWWNPASENQATDRAWRIGQEQPVFVYKLIARGTLEEKIQDMQRRKGALADALLSADAELATGISQDDLQAIFGAP